MINFLDALRIVNDEAKKIFPEEEEIDILQSLNRVIAEDVFSDVDLPPFNNSAMDGYAFRFSENRKWKLVGEVSAGNYKNYNLADDETCLITTGAKLPSSADSVVPLEEVDIIEDSIALKTEAKIKRGMNVRLCGGDLMLGESVVKKYSRITPQIVAALASCGKEKVKVFRKMRIAILSTGDELIPLNQKPVEDKLRASNPYAIHAAVAMMHQSPLMIGFVNDDKQKIKSLIENILNGDSDILITTGGVSVGKYDFLLEMFKELNVEIKFWKANIKPGKPIVFGVYNANEKRILVFGLPGNPVSCLVNFQIFVKPAIEKIFRQEESKKYFALLQNDLKKTDNKRHFSRGNLVYQNGEWQASACSSQSSGDFVEMSKSNCLIEIPEDVRNPKNGDVVECIMI